MSGNRRIFVDISPLAKDDQLRPLRAKIAHAGLRNHPGDKGMQAIADRNLDAINKPSRERVGKVNARRVNIFPESSSLHFLVATLLSVRALAEIPAGDPVSYELPTRRAKTVRVTLAIVDPKNPDWIISHSSTARRGPSRKRTAEIFRNVGRARRQFYAVLAGVIMR